MRTRGPEEKASLQIGKSGNVSVDQTLSPCLALGCLLFLEVGILKKKKTVFSFSKPLQQYIAICYRTERINHLLQDAIVADNIYIFF